MSETPELRAGPPWAMEEMIEAEPGLPAPIFAAAAEAAALVRDTGGPLVLTGCGTSEHAALAGAALLGGRARSRDAFEAALDPQDGGVLIGISHEAGTEATLEALAAAGARGARTILITALADRAPAGPLVVATPLRDASWCHTVGYLSPLLALLAIAEAPAAEAAEGVIRDVLERRAALAEAAQAVAGAERLLVVAGGADEVTARELALKIEEGAHVPTTPLGLEKVLHGHLPAHDDRTGLILLLGDRRAGDRREARARDVLASTAELGMPATLVGDLPRSDALSDVANALLAGALAAQLITLELVHALGTNPDLIRREEPAYRAAAAASGT